MWKLKSNDSITRWRDFRKSLDLLSLDQAIQSTNDFWRDCPYCPYYLDYAKPSEWPDPWQLISENYYCDIAKTLGIVYTIYFTHHGKRLDPEIRVYNEPTTNYMYNLAFLAQGKYVLNFKDNKIVNNEQIEKSLVLQHTYTAKELKLNEY
jgi:hypothetical protein